MCTSEDTLAHYLGALFIDDAMKHNMLITLFYFPPPIKSMDGYCLYLYGVVLKNLSLTSESQTILLEAIHKEPYHWGAWQELAFHISDRASLQNLQLPGTILWS